MKTLLYAGFACSLALFTASCTFGVSQAPGDKQPTVTVGGTITVQDFKNVLKIVNRNR